MAAIGKRKCPVCNEMVAAGKGFGGHMSKHSPRRKRQEKTARKAAKGPETAPKSTGRKIARSTASRPAPRAGGDLPQPPARPVSKAIHGSAAFMLREAAGRKRQEADEPDKMAERVEHLL